MRNVVQDGDRDQPAAGMPGCRCRRALDKGECSLRGIMDAVADGMLALDEHGRILCANPGAAAMFGFAPEQVQGRPLERLVGGDDRRRCRRLLRALATPAGVGKASAERLEIAAQRLDGTAFPAAMRLTPTTLAGRPGVIVALRDLTGRKQAERLIRYQATHDALTDLPNRGLFHDGVAVTLRATERRGEMSAVLLLDLDRFRVVNDTLGHAAGDALLAQVADRLKATLREGDAIARMGADAFILLVTGLQRPQEASVPARRLLEALRPPFQVEGHLLHVTASIGISLFPGDGRDAQTLLKNADIALNRAKLRGRSGVQSYCPDMNARAMERMLLENDLRQAIDREQLVLHYQPQLDLASGRICGVEALVRWQHPRHGLVPPDDFIPLAEESGLIMPMGAWILRAAFRQDARWRAEGLCLPRLSVNLSGRQFQQGDLGGMILAELEAAEMDPLRLELEITESTLMQDDEPTARALGRLLGVGIGLAMDDFGTGHSSLDHLKRLPFSRVKIDRAFVQDIATSIGDAALVRAIVAMAHGLGLRAVAEGVESQAQLARLAAFGCHEVQGFLVSEPVAAECLHAIVGRRWAMPGAERRRRQVPA